MDVRETLAEIEQRFARGDEDAKARLQQLLTWTRQAGRERRIAVLDELTARVGCLDVNAGAHFALAAGAMVEGGLPAAGLARALREPLRRVLAAAAPLTPAITELPEPDVDDDDTVSFGARTLSPRDAQAVTERDPAAATALASLDIWYLPVVAAWTRHPDVLAEAQVDVQLRSAIGAVASISEGAHWLSILIDVVVHAPFVVLVPEIDEGYAMDLRGVVDVEQLLVLLSHALQRPLKRLKASGPAPDRVLAAARGTGPQTDDEIYAATFQLHPWRATNPSTNFPEDKRFTWSAPGGVGTHSLPPDFLPGTIEPLDGVRVLMLVGPKAPGVFHFTRELGGTRTFSALSAAIENVRALASKEVEAWFAAIGRAVA